MARNILLLDKDDTLGSFPDTGFFPGAIDFVQEEFGKGRELYIATTSGAGRRSNISDIENLLSGYFCNSNLSCIYHSFYLDEDCIPRKVKEDYIERIKTLPEEQAERLIAQNQRRQEMIEELEESGINPKLLKSLGEAYNAFRDRWYNALVHRVNGEDFNKDSLYKNPNPSLGFHKDIHLARRHIDPINYESLRTVMVGDEPDVNHINSDPFTPLFKVQSDNMPDEWNAVSAMLDALYHSHNYTPWQMFDKFYVRGRSVNQVEDTKLVRVLGFDYALIRGNNNKRLILWRG